MIERRKNREDGFIATKKKISDNGYEIVFDEGSAVTTEGKLSKKKQE